MSGDDFGVGVSGGRQPNKAFAADRRDGAFFEGVLVEQWVASEAVRLMSVSGR